MALNRVQLRKLLKIFFLEPNQRRSALRADIREEIARDFKQDSGGSDFYGPFWADAKKHVFGQVDLHSAVEERIDANEGRTKLYNQLRDGFLLWWNERRRWTNEPFMQGPSLGGRVNFNELSAEVRVDNILSVKDGVGENHIVYPYFSPNPDISENAARLGIWLISAAIPDAPIHEVRILDVIRGRTFSIDRCPLLDNEQEEFISRYSAALKEREILRREYY